MVSASEWSATSIVAPVPAGATTGNVIVTVNGVASNAPVFTVYPNPSITGFSPGSGFAGTSVTVTGTNFGANRGVGSAVSFNGTPVNTFTSWSDTQLVVAVPSGATTGPIAVVVNGITATSSAAFQINNPIINSVAPPTAYGYAHGCGSEPAAR